MVFLHKKKVTKTKVAVMNCQILLLQLKERKPKFKNAYRLQ